MSASMKPVAAPAWSPAEIARAKELRAEGYTHGSIAGALNAEFGNGRNRHGVEKALSRYLRPEAHRAQDAARQAARRLAVKAKTVTVLQLVPRYCLGPGCLGQRAFESTGPGHRVCSDCKRLEGWS